MSCKVNGTVNNSFLLHFQVVTNYPDFTESPVVYTIWYGYLSGLMKRLMIFLTSLYVAQYSANIFGYAPHYT